MEPPGSSLPSKLQGHLDNADGSLVNAANKLTLKTKGNLVKTKEKLAEKKGRIAGKMNATKEKLKLNTPLFTPLYESTPDTDMNEAKTVFQSVAHTSRKHMSEISLVWEYGVLKTISPSGVYALPTWADTHRWDGVIFVRRGLYKSGIFRFVITFPPNYNMKGTRPIVYFVPPIFNPLVDEKTGELQLEHFFPEWEPSSCTAYSVLTVIKRIFYAKEFNVELPYNRKACKMFKNNNKAYTEKAEECVLKSFDHLYDPGHPHMFMFAREKKVHNDILQRMKKCIEETDGEGNEAEQGALEGTAISMMTLQHPEGED